MEARGEHMNEIVFGSPLEPSLLLLLALHDGDGSGHLDGLEVMRLLSDLGGRQARGQPILDMVMWKHERGDRMDAGTESPRLPLLSLQVERMVDHLLETQDRNGDGFLEPMEVLLGPRQAQPPRSPSGPSKSEEEAVEEGAMPRPEGPRPGGEGPGPPGGPGP
ncbi:cell growth regulator with EF hand domain protein 1 [Anolis sagrei]|uniref:cell growth regulator with EF hand domain protein 1 n=1 Tax=Anolis sagrei TaxID=38937 RepID=UPI0035219E77